MVDLCIGLIGCVLLFVFGNLIYGDWIPKDSGHPIQQETINMNRTSKNLGDWWEHIEAEEE